MWKSHYFTWGHFPRLKSMNLTISSSCAADRSAIETWSPQRYFVFLSCVSISLRERASMISWNSSTLHEYVTFQRRGAKTFLITCQHAPYRSHVWCWSRYSLIRACCSRLLAGYQCSAIFSRYAVARYRIIAWLSPRFRITSPVYSSMTCIAGTLSAGFTFAYSSVLFSFLNVWTSFTSNGMLFSLQRLTTAQAGELPQST